MNDLRPVNLTVCRCPLCQTRLQSEDDVRKHIISHHVGEHANPSDMYVKIQESVVQYQNKLRELIDLDIRFAGISALLDCLMADAQPCAVDGSCLFHQRAEDGRCVFDGTVMHGAQVLKRILIGVEHCRLIYDGRQSRHLRKWLLGPPSESLVARALAALQSESMCTLQCKVREPKLSGSAAGTSSSTNDRHERHVILTNVPMTSEGQWPSKHVDDGKINHFVAIIFQFLYEDAERLQKELMSKSYTAQVRRCALHMEDSSGLRNKIDQHVGPGWSFKFETLYQGPQRLFVLRTLKKEVDAMLRKLGVESKRMSDRRLQNLMASSRYYYRSKCSCLQGTCEICAVPERHVSEPLEQYRARIEYHHKGALAEAKKTIPEPRVSFKRAEPEDYEEKKWFLFLRTREKKIAREQTRAQIAEAATSSTFDATVACAMPRISNKKHLENTLARWDDRAVYKHPAHFDASEAMATPSDKTALNGWYTIPSVVSGYYPECTRASEKWCKSTSGELFTRVIDQYFVDFNKVPRQHKEAIDTLIADAARNGQTMSALYKMIDRYKKHKGIDFTLPFNYVKPKFRAQVAEARREEIRLEQEERAGPLGLRF